MKRSLAISAAVLCALYGTRASEAQSITGRFDGSGVEIRFSNGGSGASLRELERAEHRLHLARRAVEDAKCKRDELLARREGAFRELKDIERKIAECRPEDEYKLHYLREQLEAARCRASEIEADLSRLAILAAEARRAADAARADYFRRAESSGVVFGARQNIERATYDLEDARRSALDRLHASYEWRRAHDWRDDVSRRLEEAIRCRVSRYEIERLRRELSDAEERLAAMKHEALARDPAVCDAEARLASAQRAYDELWASVERDLERDPAYDRAVCYAQNLERDQAVAHEGLRRVQADISGLEQEIDRLAGAHFVVNIRGLEEKAASLRWTLDRLAGEIRAAEECLRRAGGELHDAQCAYDAALAAHRRCLEQERRHHERPRYEPPRHDYERERRDDHRRHEDDRDDDRRHDGRSQRRDDDDNDDRRADERSGDDRRDDDRSSRQRADARQADQSAAQRPRERQQQAEARRDDRVGSAGSSGGSHGTYRDRGERYQRAHEQDASRRTRD